MLFRSKFDLWPWYNWDNICDLIGIVLLINSSMNILLLGHILHDLTSSHDMTILNPIFWEFILNYVRINMLGTR